MTISNVDLNGIKKIIFDFDGVFTDNTVLIDSKGREFLRFSKLDSLGLDIFKNFVSNHKLEIELVVISQEKNPIVRARCKKLHLQCYQGISDKLTFISHELDLAENSYICFGNDLNDLGAMSKAKISLAPEDAHYRIKEIASVIIDRRGGEGFVRAGLEWLMNSVVVNNEGK